MNFAEALKTSTMDIFTTMLNLPLEFKEINAKGSEKNLKFDISGIIGLAGNYQGSVAIHTSKSIAMKITSAMLGMDIDSITPEVEDCIGEMANMVTGGAKTALSSEGVDFDLSLPTVVVGDNHSTNQINQGGESGVIYFQCETQNIVVEFMIKKT